MKLINFNTIIKQLKDIMNLQQIIDTNDIFDSWSLFQEQTTYFEKGKEISSQKYENLISWSFQVGLVQKSSYQDMMNSLNIENTTKGLIKVYLDQIIKTKSLQTIKQYKLFNLIYFQIALPISQVYNQQLLAYIRKIAENLYSDEQLAVTKMSLLQILNFETEFQNIFSWLQKFQFAPQESSESLQSELIDIINISCLCYQLINFNPRIVFLSCVKYLFYCNKKSETIINQQKSFLQKKEVIKAFDILKRFIEQEQES